MPAVLIFKYDENIIFARLIIYGYDLIDTYILVYFLNITAIRNYKIY